MAAAAGVAAGRFRETARAPSRITVRNTNELPPRRVLCKMCFFPNGMPKKRTAGVSHRKKLASGSIVKIENAAEMGVEIFGIGARHLGSVRRVVGRMCAPTPPHKQNLARCWLDCCWQLMLRSMYTLFQFLSGQIKIEEIHDSKNIDEASLAEPN